MKFNNNPSYLLVMLLAISIAMMGCGGKEARLAKHMQKGKAYLEQADYEKARIEFKNVLQIAPKNADAFYMTGLLEERQENLANAFNSYSMAIELNPGHIDAKGRLAKLYLMTGESVKAEKLVDEILANKPENITARTLRAALMASKGDVIGAIKEANQIIEKDPTQFETVSMLAALYTKQGDEAKAQEMVEKGIKANPKSVSLRMELVALLMRHNDYARAEQQLIEVVAADPKSLEARARLAAFYAGMNKLDRAENVLRTAIKDEPEDEQRYLLLADLLVNRKGPEVAEKELLSVIKNKPNAYKLRFGLVKLYKSMNQPEKLRQLYLDIIDIDKTGPEGLKARIQLAQIEVEAGKNEAASKLIAEVLNENPKDSAALLLRANMSMAMGDIRSAIVDFRSLLKDQPESVEFLGLLANAHIANNEMEMAKETFSNAVSKFRDNWKIRMAKVDFLIATKDYDSALREVQYLIKADPSNIAGLQAMAEILASKKDWNGAEETISKLKVLLPEQSLAYYRLGLIYYAQKKFDQAMREFEMALSKSPNDIEPLTVMVGMLNEQGKGDKAVARINQTILAAPDNFLAHLLLGETYVNQQKYPEADGAFRKALQLNPKVNNAYLYLADLNLKRGDAKAAIRLMQQGLATIPSDIIMSKVLAESYQLAGEGDKAVAEYETILKKGPRNDEVANGLASLLADRGDKSSLDKALGLAKRFENSANLDFVDTLGWVYFKSGQNALALPLLQKVVNLAPLNPVYQYHLGMVLNKQGNLKAAKIALQKAVDSKSNFPGIEEAKGVLAKI